MGKTIEMRALVVAAAVAGLAGALGPGEVRAVGLEDLYDHGEVLPEQTPWQEGVSALPAYPDDADLIPFRVDTGVTPFRFYVDRASLSAGTDNVARYIVVIAAGSGARNVMFEGIRCDTREYKTYAYGSPDKTLSAMPDPRWQPISDLGALRYRFDLYRDYLCRDESVLGVRAMLKALSHYENEVQRTGHE